MQAFQRNCETGVLEGHRSHGRIDNCSQVFDNSQQNSLRGVITGSLSVLPFFARRAERLIRAESPSTLFALGAPPILSMFFSSAHKRIPIPALFRSAQVHTNPCFLSAQAHTNSCPFLSAQAHTNPCPFRQRASAYQSMPFSSARTSVHLLQPRRSSACQSVVFFLGARAHADL
jgi:hypothetical protein